MPPANRYDAIIIGGGHNGLVTAAYLARAGRRVCVLERRELLGGCAVTEEIWPGYKVSTAAYLSSLMQERIVRELDLERHGYHVDPKEPPFFSPFPDGRHLFFWQDEKRTHAEIKEVDIRLPEPEPHGGSTDGETPRMPAPHEPTSHQRGLKGETGGFVRPWPLRAQFAPEGEVPPTTTGMQAKARSESRGVAVDFRR